MFLSGFAEAADGFVNPAIEGGETRVDAGQVGAAAADAEADDAHLEPLTVFGAHQRSTSVTLQKFNPNQNESANQITTIKKKKKKKKKKKNLRRRRLFLLRRRRWTSSEGQSWARTASVAPLDTCRGSTEVLQSPSESPSEPNLFIKTI